MSTTTIRIDEALKERIAAAAERSGKSPHAFIVDAVAQTVDRLEEEDELHRVADVRWSKIAATGATVSWDKAKNYLAARARGEKAAKPAARKSTKSRAT